jgi:molybdenum cofactor biosynthesis enzyme MoaA
MSRAQVRRYLEESVKYGVKEYYFTGGEPFMNRNLLDVLADALEFGPATVLSNGILISPKVAKRLRQLADGSIYSLELRISLDGFTEFTNDVIRGEGSFRKTLAGVKNLVEENFLPIITCMQSWEENETECVLEGFREVLRGIGYTRPRLKIIPALRIGREEMRSYGYTNSEFVTPEMMEGYDNRQLLCATSRMVTDRGIYVCPILIEKPDAKLGDTLEEALTPFALRHQACYTCYLAGAICSNFSPVRNEQ